MADREELLRELTHKDDCEDNLHRIFYTLTDKPEELTTIRTANVLAGLMELLIKKEIITEQELDALLLRCRG